MKKIVLASFCILALASIPSLATAAEAPADPVVPVSLDQIFEAPPEAADPEQFSPAEGMLFVDAVDDAAYNACCQGAFAVCATSCAADVSSFYCYRVGARGCNSQCHCN